YGMTVTPSNVEEVESLSKVGQVERLRLWSRVDEETGLKIEVFRPMGETPEGFTEVRTPLTATITSGVEVPANSPAEVVRLAMDPASEQANRMKQEGIDRPRAPGAPTSAGPDAVVRMSLADRLNATSSGRQIFNASLFAGSEIVSEAIMQLATGQSRL